MKEKMRRMSTISTLQMQNLRTSITAGFVSSMSEDMESDSGSETDSARIVGIPEEDKGGAGSDVDIVAAEGGDVADAGTVDAGTDVAALEVLSELPSLGEKKGLLPAMHHSSLILDSRAGRSKRHIGE